MVATSEQTGLIVFAHGSRVAPANEGVEHVTAEAATLGGFDLFSAAFLELASPTLEEAVEKLVGAQARRIVVVPYFLTMGIHLTRDLPAILSAIRAKHPGLELDAAPPLDGHPALAAILAERAQSLSGRTESESQRRRRT